ncbi:LLM class flavin-dependent oxidoreductase [Chelatococcus asaccharovorans]|uniref:Luciferase family oxidoreductase group 1 n=1 Tax=Chelatococcus asaccharovorans TaxID=28210 RepID=A0A2V3U4U6_9HYPH|nr:LLM class flavin-dependent oxidoreductase [Chelatococcus asaccharovorans]MBS7703779.1 LLM class flavin-dependent oxidoreductase [Chelatococcus asaccharovorans]PXW57939.1 luciferase family oxidoreductase group 1 [Chelatococcus asaccharovorans]
MSYKLSILDKAPVPPGASADVALRNTIALARRADQLGYHRFWVAEHHGSSALASSAPEILVSHILAQTSRIRVGSGGVMLQHYSPYKVAEVFRVLESLAPGRVDLGIGKAPGGLPFATRALQAFHDPAKKPDFEAAFAELDGFLTGTLAPEHPLASAVVTPAPSATPARILLGGSPASAELAARHGWDFSYAGHFNGDPANIEATFRTYHDRTGRSPSLALYAFAASSRERAESLVGELRIYTAHLPGGQRVNLPSLEAVAEFTRQAGTTEYRVEEKRPHVIAGTPETVRAELDDLARRFGVTEFIVDNPVAAFAERLASIELLAGSVSSLAA